MEPKTNGDINFEELLLGTATRVRHITRWSGFHKIHPETVAEHSFFTAFLVLVIGTDLRNRGEKINMDVALSRAIMHDVDEVFSGDFIRTFKHSNETLLNAINEALRGYFRQFCNTISGGESRLATTLNWTWLHAKHAEQIEGQLVALADFLSLISYVMCEMRSGNTHLLGRTESLREYGAMFLRNETLAPYVIPALEIFEVEVEACTMHRRNLIS